MRFLLFTDGGARGNPGKAGCGAVLADEQGTVLGKEKKYLGEKTNNQAEYEGLLLGLKMALEKDAADLVVFMDSELLVKQMRGEFKVKNPELRKLNLEAQELAGKLEKVCFEHVPREKNKLADSLANQAMDAEK